MKMDQLLPEYDWTNHNILRHFNDTEHKVWSRLIRSHTGRTTGAELTDYHDGHEEDVIQIRWSCPSEASRNHLLRNLLGCAGAGQGGIRFRKSPGLTVNIQFEKFDEPRVDPLQYYFIGDSHLHRLLRAGQHPDDELWDEACQQHNLTRAPRWAPSRPCRRWR